MWFPATLVRRDAVELYPGETSGGEICSFYPPAGATIRAEAYPSQPGLTVVAHAWDDTTHYGLGTPLVPVTLPYTVPYEFTGFITITEDLTPTIEDIEGQVGGPFATYNYQAYTVAVWSQELNGTPPVFGEVAAPPDSLVVTSGLVVNTAGQTSPVWVQVETDDPWSIDITYDAEYPSARYDIYDSSGALYDGEPGWPAGTYWVAVIDMGEPVDLPTDGYNFASADFGFWVADGPVVSFNSISATFDQRASLFWANLINCTQT